MKVQRHKASICAFLFYSDIGGWWQGMNRMNSLEFFHRSLDD